MAGPPAQLPAAGTLWRPGSFAAETPEPGSQPHQPHVPGAALLGAVAAGLRGTAGDAPDAYLGVLATEEELRVFGFMTNTKAKLMVVVDGPVAKDDEMRAVSSSRPTGPGHDLAVAVTLDGLCACLPGVLPVARLLGLHIIAVDHDDLMSPPLCRPVPSARLFDAACWSSCCQRCLSSAPQQRPSPLRLQIFRRMHAAFVDAVSNPFYVIGTPLASPRFDASIRTIATSLGALA